MSWIKKHLTFTATVEHHTTWNEFSLLSVFIFSIAWTFLNKKDNIPESKYTLTYYIQCFSKYEYSKNILCALIH